MKGPVFICILFVVLKTILKITEKKNRNMKFCDGFLNIFWF